MQILFLQKCITNMQNPISRQHCRHIVHSIVKSNPLHNLKSSFEIIRHIFRWSCWDNLRRLQVRWASGITTKSILVKCSLFFGYYRTAVFSLCTLIGAVYRAAVFLLVYIDWYCVQGSCFSPCLHWLVECTGQLFFSLFTLIGAVYRAAALLVRYMGQLCGGFRIRSYIDRIWIQPPRTNRILKPGTKTIYLFTTYLFSSEA